MRPLIVTLTLALVLTVPAGVADHALLYTTFTPGVTYEDDGVVMHAPGNPLDGFTNRVVHPGRTAGDGSLFLDARLGTNVAGNHVYTDFFIRSATGRSNILAPGLIHPSAWYGWWSDADSDGVIDDVHDAACGGAACPDDEFLWRGDATDEGPRVIQFQVPYIAITPLVGGPERIGASSVVRPETYRVTHFNDLTAKTRGVQEWVGDQSLPMLDASTLATIQTLVVAGARPLTVGFVDLDDPAGLHDVDRYESISQDVETLYTSSTRGSPETPAPREYLDAVNDAWAGVLTLVLGIATDLVGDPEVPETFEAREAARESAYGVVYDAAFPAYAKEPNHVDDDYGGLALFGGVGDAVGSHNTYDAYAGAVHFYVDNLPRFHVCPTVNANPTSSTCTVSAGPGMSNLAIDVAGAARGERGGTAVMTFEATPLLWKDLNLDTHIGNVCDPDPEEFDFERNTCRSDVRYYPRPWPHFLTSENTRVCSSTQGRSGGITLTPVGGAWSGATIIRNYEQPGAAGAGTLEARFDADPIILSWRGSCEGVNSHMASNDALVLPLTNGVPIRVETTLSIAGFKDVGLGIDVGHESITDVDILAASL